MPFTPFHMGVALVVKPAAGRHFSVISFGLAQVLMDIEPGVGMLLEWDVLHGYSHTLPGALLISMLAAWAASWSAPVLLARWNREFRPLSLRWLQVQAGVSNQAVLVGAFTGSLTHLALDALIHRDMRPFWPITPSNPMVGIVDQDAVYLGCAVAIAIGSVLWLVFQWARARRQSRLF